MSPSRSTRRRRTPWVAGWCGPMLIVMISRSRSGAPSYSAKVDSGGVSSRSALIPVSASRFGSVIPRLAVGEGDGLPANWEVTPLGPPHVVLRHQDPSQVRMPSEHDPEEVEYFPLLGLRRGEQLDAAVDLRQLLLQRPSRGWRRFRGLRR